MSFQEIIVAIVSGFSSAALMLSIAIYFIKRWITVTDQTLKDLDEKIEKHHKTVNDKIESYTVKSAATAQMMERELLRNDDKIKEMIISLRNDLPQEYVRRQEYEVRHTLIREELGKIDEKMDKTAAKADEILKILIKGGHNG